MIRDKVRGMAADPISLDMLVIITLHVKSIFWLKKKFYLKFCVDLHSSNTTEL